MPDMSFLKILNSALKGEQFTVDTPLSEDEWLHIFTLAENHKVLPLVFDAVYSAFSADTPWFEKIKTRAKLLVSQQAIKTLDFLKTYKTLSDHGLEPVVFKGIICRELYPNPDFRPSSDEDILIVPSEVDRYKEAFATAELYPLNEDNLSHYQTTFLNKAGLCIELHKSLFPDNSDYFSPWNRIFENADARAIYINISGTKTKTLCPTDHLLYLILHTLKHFLHSGVGIRQVCDIVLFSRRYEAEIDWQQIFCKCEELHALQFALALFAIGEKHLDLKLHDPHYKNVWQKTTVDEKPLLQDILSAGVYGSADLGRRHSSSITFNAAQGKKENVAKKVFPSVKSLNSRYRYAKKLPILLPVAWSHRLISYSKEINKEERNTPRHSLQIGKERLELLVKYGLIPD